MGTVGSVGFASVFMAVLGIVLAGVLAFANRKLFVEEDPRIDEVEGLLPKSNCGACGTAGCRNFAEKVVAGELAPGQCTVSSPAQRAEIAGLLGVAAGEFERRVARLACAGGSHVAYTRTRYRGHKSCRAAAVVSGGGKECAWGCLGLGDCVSACSFGAIALNANGLPVVDSEKCSACNDCVEVCPKGLFSLEPVSRRLWVACRNRADAAAAEAACEVACTACGKCVADAVPGLLKLNRNLVEVDYDWNDKADRTIADRCAPGAIVWYETPDCPVRGQAARKILRREALPTPN